MTTTAARVPTQPRRAARPRTQAEKEFLALGPVAEAFLTGAAAAGVTKLTSEIAEILTLGAAHGTDAAAGGAGTGGGVRPVARRRRPLDPGHQRPRTPTHARRAGAGADPAHGADQVAGRLPRSTDRSTGSREVRCRDRDDPAAAGRRT